MNLTCLGYYTNCMTNVGRIIDVGLIFENEEGRIYYSGETRIEALKYHINTIEDQVNSWFIQNHPRYNEWSGQNFFNTEVFGDPEDANRIITNEFLRLTYDDIRELLEANYRVNWTLSDGALDFYKEFIKEFLYYSIGETSNSIEPGEFGLTDKGDIYCYLGYFRHKIKILNEDNVSLYQYRPNRKKHFYIKIKELTTDIGFYGEDLNDYLRTIVGMNIENWDSNGTMQTIRASLSKIPFVQTINLMQDFQPINAGNTIQFKMNSKQLYAEIKRNNRSNLLDTSLNEYSRIRREDIERIVGENFILQIEVLS